MGTVKIKRERGRPKVEVDLAEVEDLASEGNRCEDIARVLGFSKATLFGREDIREAYEKGRAQLAVNLRHWQILCAKDGNPNMLIWLGKQYLDQADKREVDTTASEPIKVVIDV